MIIALRGGSIDLERQGRLEHRKPCDITSIDDGIANYDLLVEFFADASDQSDPGMHQS